MQGSARVYLLTVSFRDARIWLSPSSDRRSRDSSAFKWQVANLLMTETDASLMSGTDESTQTLSLMEEFLNDPSLEYKSLKYGDVMDGVIMRIDRDEILVDIGSKSEGIVP